MILGDVNFPKLFVLIFWRPLKPFKGPPPSRVKKDHAEFKYNVAPKEVTCSQALELVHSSAGGEVPLYFFLYLPDSA
jgi:hypothetical protein